MALLTQKEIADKYEISQPYVSAAIKGAGIKPGGQKMGAKRMLNTYDEKAVMTAVLAQYETAAKRAKNTWEAAEASYRRLEARSKANGLIDNPRWRL